MTNKSCYKLSNHVTIPTPTPTCAFQFDMYPPAIAKTKPRANERVLGLAISPVQ